MRDFSIDNDFRHWESSAVVIERLGICAGACLGLLAATAVHAQRQAVLPQIDLPHPYYYRELYLPQLTSGPSSVAWAPNSREVVYSMDGSLWRQKIDSGTAEQLTDGAGYDYQPDWSPDGRCIVYVSYRHDAMELWLLDVASGSTHPLTAGGAVNVEPRWSPDGRQLAWVSTAFNRRFHIFVAEVRNGQLVDERRVTGENKSTLPRYYYSAYDHELSPAWAPDGRSLLFVSNRGHIYGTGGFWSMAVEPGAAAHEIHYEETNWGARPSFSPDGRFLVYSSYLGRNWLQLWVMPSGGGDAFPLSYGEWDETGARWSPDGRQLAFISNRQGDTELRLQTIPGVGSRSLEIQERHALRPVGTLELTVRDEHGQPTPARVVVADDRGRFHAPAHAWVHADDGYDRAERPVEAHYFHSTGHDVIVAPTGEVTIEVMKGFERPMERRTARIVTGRTTALEVGLQASDWPGVRGGKWVSADVHVHMNYGGHYRNTPAHLAMQAEAEDLGIIENLIVNKEQRVPDAPFAGRQLDPDSRPDAWIVHGQEYHSSYWGHLGVLNLRGGIILPGYVGYPNTAAASLYPTNADVADIAHAQGGVVGYVHPFHWEPQPVTSPDEIITDEFPIDVALGKVDYIEIVGFSDHRSTAAVWYRLLNLGFRLPAAGGTDAMANYASIHGPVGMNRVYAWVPGETVDSESWLSALKAGRTFATNGPLLDFTLGGNPVGDEIKIEEGPHSLPFTAKLRTIVPVDHLEVVCNGRVVREIALGERRDSADVSGTIPVEHSGWCLLRASSERAEYPVLDQYVYATTSPVYVTLGGSRPRSPSDASYFLAWIDRVTASTTAYPDWNSPAEKEGVLRELRDGARVFRTLQ
jgi:TolB protein